MKRKNSWTKEEDDILTSNYGKISNKDLSLLLNRSRNAVILRAFNLKVNKVNYKEWTEEERQILKDIYLTWKRKDIVNKLNRKWKCIKSMATKLGVKRLTPHLDETNGDLSILLEDSSISLYWIGFILADGHISDKNRLIITLSNLDTNHLKKISELLKTKMRTYKNKVTIAIMDKYKICLLKEKYNINNLKTYNPPDVKIFEKLPDDLFLSLLIGFIDGDGTIQNRKKTKNKHLAIKCHSSWLDILNYFISRVAKLVGINLPLGYIDKRGYAQVYITNNIHIKYLKQKAIELNLPILNRKWDKIDLSFISKQEKTKERRKIVLNLLKDNLTANDIAKKLNEKITIVWSDIRHLR